MFFLAFAVSLKVFLSGDIEGNFGRLFQTVSLQQEKVGKFDLLLAAGNCMTRVAG